MSLQWIPGRVVKKQVWSEGLFTLSVHCRGVHDFEPGQFLQLGLQLPEKHLHRPYSAASPYSETIEFFIVRVEGGELTPRLWDLPLDAKIDISQKATGGFTLSHTPHSRNIWLIATGTGLAPYIAMLRDPMIWSRHEKIVLVHGVRHATDLAYLDELAAYESKYSNQFRFLAATSRDSVPGRLAGRVTTKLDDGSLEEIAGVKISPTDSAVMLCGNPDMLNEMEAMLERRGLERQKPKHPGQIIIERYW